MTLLAVGVSWALAATALFVAVRVHRRTQELLDSPQTATSEPYDDEPIREAIAQLTEFVEAMDGRVNELHLAIDEGIQHVDRSERRVRAVVQRAQRRLADAGYEDEGVEAEARALPQPHGVLVQGEGVPALPPSLDSDRFAAFPGSFDGFGG